MGIVFMDVEQERADAISRRIEYLYRWRDDFFWSCERFAIRRTDAFNVWIGVVSAFSESILERIGREVFPGFGNRQSKTRGGWHWAHFGY